MKTLSVAVVVCGLGLALALAVERGFDTYSLVLLVLLFLVGGVVVGVAGRSRSGRVAPAQCEACGGLVSPNAPYCKHCGASFV